MLLLVDFDVGVVLVLGVESSVGILLVLVLIHVLLVYIANTFILIKIS